MIMKTCSYCKAQNPPDTRFCANCASPFSFSAPPPAKKGISTPVAIIITVVAMFGICGFIGVIGSIVEKTKPQNSNSSVASRTNSNAATPVPLLQTPAPASTLTPNTSPAALTVSPTAAKTNSSSGSATVIAENAALRKSANEDGEAVETLSTGASVEVIKQNGAWFLVKSGNREGWIHGNAIRLAKTNIGGPTAGTTPKPESYTEQRSYSTPEPRINTSGASALCRDGTLSYSAHRRGTCSHHGGVAQWY